MPHHHGSSMDHLMGLLKINVQRGVNLAVRDVRSSDPYVIVKMGSQVTFLVPHQPFLGTVYSLLKFHSFQFQDSGTAAVEYSGICLTLIAMTTIQKLKTRVVKKNTNPEWNEELTLSIADPNLPIKVVSMDRNGNDEARSPPSPICFRILNHSMWS